MWNSVECPYCGCENDMSDALTDLSNNDNTFDSECGSCEKDFEVEVEFDPQYNASKIVYEECEKCGKETRDSAKRGKIFPYPKSLRENTVCKSCFFKGHHEDDVKKHTEQFD